MKPIICIGRIVVLAIVAVLSLSGCGGTDDINAPEYKSFDRQIYGDWVYVPESDDGEMPSVAGIRLLENRELRSMGVETETGTLAELPNGDTWRVTGAFQGEIQLERNPVPWDPDYVQTHELSYRCTDTELVFDDWFGLGDRVFLRSSVGARVTDPIVSQLEVDAGDDSHDDQTWTNIAVSTSPSAYAFIRTMPNDGHALVIWASTNGPRVEILIDGVDAPGTYEIDNEFRWIKTTSGGCAIVEYRTDPAVNAGTVTIDTFDPASGRCSGTFSAVVRKMYFETDPINLTNGRFDVPIYNSPFQIQQQRSPCY
jgi:hypothetical protein